MTRQRDYSAMEVRVVKPAAVAGSGDTLPQLAEMFSNIVAECKVSTEQ